MDSKVERISLNIGLPWIKAQTFIIQMKHTYVAYLHANVT